MTMQNRRIIAAVIVAVAVGWWATHAASSPFTPKPKDRPVMRFLAKVAKIGLWVAMAAEKPIAPDDAESRQMIARFDESGNRVLSHGEGW